MKKLRVLVTGATGMVGEGVMHQCLQHESVGEVVIINRRTSGYAHPKLTEILLPDFFVLDAIRPLLAGFDACYFCLGVSSVGMNEADFTRQTYELTMGFARALLQASPQADFCYISGAGTDTSENGRLMWARVKGKTENDLHQLGFRKAYAFRPGIIIPIKGLTRTLKAYKYMGWLIPLFKLIMPNGICTLQAIGDAMINSTLQGYDPWILEVKDIKKLAGHA